MNTKVNSDLVTCHLSTITKTNKQTKRAPRNVGNHLATLSCYVLAALKLSFLMFPK